MLPALQKHVVRLRIPGSSARNALSVILGQFHGQGGDHIARDFVLKSENVLQVSVVAIRPHVTAGRCVDELRVDPYLGTAATHAPLQHVAHPQRLGHLANVRCFALVHKRRISRDDKQSGDLGQVSD